MFFGVHINVICFKVIFFMLNEASYFILMEFYRTYFVFANFKLVIVLFHSVSLYLIIEVRCFSLCKLILFALKLYFLMLNKTAYFILMGFHGMYFPDKILNLFLILFCFNLISVYLYSKRTL